VGGFSNFKLIYRQRIVVRAISLHLARKLTRRIALIKKCGLRARTTRA